MNQEFLLETILRFLDEGVLVVDKEARVTFLNEPAGAITGINREQAIGRSIFEIFPELTPENSTLYRVLKSAKPLVDYVQTYTNHQGQTITKVTSTLPLHQDGQVIGALEIYREVSHLKKLMERLNLLEQQLYYKKSGQKDKGQLSNGTQYRLEDMIGISPAVVSLREAIAQVAESTSSVLIYGETGTGKELAVQSLHNLSHSRRHKPFIAQNCAAIPHTLLESMLFGTAAGSFTGAQDKPGLFELAHQGTLFLDEINALDFDLQAKLLRVLQDGLVRRVGGSRSQQVQVRVVAATNEDPQELVASGRLRPDLYYRLNVISLRIPPLRERREDIPALVQHFIALYNRRMRLSVQAVDGACLSAFMAYHWPGNVRELQFAIERLMNFAKGPVLQYQDLGDLLTGKPLSLYGASAPGPIGSLPPPSAPIPAPATTAPETAASHSLAEQLSAYERHVIQGALEAAGGNAALAARNLGLPRQTLHHKIKRLGLS